MRRPHLELLLLVLEFLLRLPPLLLRAGQHPVLLLLGLLPVLLALAAPLRRRALQALRLEG